jgi:hypothetical protein
MDVSDQIKDTVSEALNEVGWEYSILDTDDAKAVAHYEQTLYTNFHPILEKNPLVRDLWVWDDVNKRMRTRAPYPQQLVFLMRHRVTGAIASSVGVNLDLDAFWQTGHYGFKCPDLSETPCELMILAHGDSERLNGVYIIRNFIFRYIFSELHTRGYHCAYATTADHLRRAYLWFGARALEERIVSGHRRTLVCWDLEATAKQRLSDR